MSEDHAPSFPASESPTLPQRSDDPSDASLSMAGLPPLMRDPSYWGILTTQFLGAFNDNLYKQLILLLAVPVAAVVAQGDPQPEAAGQDVQGWASMVFALPFVIFSGYAGFLSDRFSKRRVIVLSKIAEVVVMLLGMIAFLLYDRWAAYGTWTVLFLMGTQSTFFGPGKYGILPELFRASDLPKANGLILMTTFLAIIFGTVVAGFLFDHLSEGATDEVMSAKGLWIGSCACIFIAVVGTWTATWIRSTKTAQPNATLSIDDWGLAAPIRHLLCSDLPLLNAILVSCVFWMVAGLAVPIVNRLGTSQLHVDKGSTSILVAAIALGIMIGSLLAAVVFKRLKPRGQVTLGLCGMVATLILLGGWKEGGEHWLGYRWSFFGLATLGIFAAIYAVPLQVFLQSRPPAHLRGRMIGTMNQANFIGILLSGPLYQGFEAITMSIGWPISSIFWILALLLMPLAIFYRLGGSSSSEAGA